MARLPLQGLDTRPMWQPGELDQPRIQTVSLAELHVGKLLAFLDRAAPRDAWDVARLPALAPGLTTSPAFRSLFLAMSATLKHPVTSYDRARMKQRLTQERINAALVPMLVVRSLADTDTIVERAWQVVEPLLNLSENESTYVEAAQQGDLRLDLLYPDDPGTAAHLAAHPAIRWKIHNAASHAKSRQERH